MKQAWKRFMTEELRMSSNNINRMLNLNSTNDCELLMEEARRYFVYSVKRVSEEIRGVDNIDIHLWVFRFISNKVRSGRIHDDDLATNIIQLTYALWTSALHIVEEHEQSVIDGEGSDE